MSIVFEVEAAVRRKDKGNSIRILLIGLSKILLASDINMFVCI